MSYTQFGLVEAVDFNALSGNTVTSSPNTFNSMWGVGYGNAGYGQSPVDPVADGEVVMASNWADLITKAGKAAGHQGSGITAIPTPGVGDTIAYLNNVSNNVTGLYTQRNNALTQGTTTYHETICGSSWTDRLVFNMTATFISGDHARYFFNAGGQLEVSFYHPSGDRVDAFFNTLSAACGSIVLGSSSGSNTNLVNATRYHGITKIGGSGTPEFIDSAKGYYDLGTTDTDGDGIVFKQTVGGTPTRYAGYVGSFIQVRAKTNGAQGLNGDNGNVVTMKVVFAQKPRHGIAISPNTTVTITCRPPSSVYLTNSWGAVGLDGSVSSESYQLYN